MGHPILSVKDALKAASEPTCYLVWVREPEAQRFRKHGWLRLEPPREGAVLFVHRQRELRVTRAREDTALSPTGAAPNGRPASTGG
jgi:hypothetical protein